MKRVPVMGNVQILATVLVATATMAHRLTAWKVRNKSELRVYQGIDDVTTKYPYVVMLQPRRFCTGSLITPDWVLTAAHCSVREPSYIQYGKLSIPLNVTDSKSEVIKSLPNPRYKYSQLPMYDIALLLVSPGVRMDKYGTISAVDYTTLLGLSAEYVGGGITYIPKRNSRTKWKNEQRLLLPLKIGQGVVSPCKPIFRGHICLARRCSTKQIAMPGDSGAPLLVDNKLVGVYYGAPIEGNYENRDRLFTPISPHQEWIYSVITASKPN